MALEIERKYLVKDYSYREKSTEKHHLVQGYLSLNPDATVRIRISDDSAWVTIKSRNRGAVRNEWEYPIPVDDARQMLELCQGGVLSKWRYIVPVEDQKWEIDEFEGHLAPLVVAEIELDDENEIFGKPGFIGREVTGNPHYYNSSLISRKPEIE